MSQQYWKSLEELAASPEMLEQVAHEFAGYEPDEITGPSRRRFMQLMAASMALAGLTLSGCRRWPKQSIAPYSSNPRNRVPGIPEQYATVYELGGVGHGLLVTSYDGRPVKIEGNPSHPFAQTFDGKLGSADAYAQASVLELYDPDRSRGVIDRTGPEQKWATWEELLAALAPLRTLGGKGLAVLSETSLSPSVADMRARLLAKLPQTQWFEYEPIKRDNEIQGAVLAFGKPLRTRLHLDKADIVVCLDADILGEHPAHIRYANDWSKRRRSADAHRGMNRMYVAESCRSITGAVADERIGIKPSQFLQLVSSMLAQGGDWPFAKLVLEDLKRHQGTSAVVTGPSLAPELHAAVHALNDSIGAFGKTVTLLDVPDQKTRTIQQLSEQIGSGAVTTLLIIGGNPVYDAPADLELARVISAVANSIHLSHYDNETSQKCKWHVPRAHYLESWGDARAWDGTISIQQPLILPLFGGKSSVELLAMLSGDELGDGEKIVRRTHAKLSDSDYRRALHDGVVPNSAFSVITAKPQATTVAAASAKTTYEFRFLPDQSVYDGRFANSGWLQELPDAMSKLTWDNAALISKSDADQLGVTNGGVIRVDHGSRNLEMPVFILPGQPLGVIGLPLGYGRTAAGHVGNGVGFNVYALRTSDAMHSYDASEIRSSRGIKSYPLAATQEHHIIDKVGFEGREDRVGKKGEPGRIIREATLAAFEKDHHAPHHGQHHVVPLQIFEEPSSFDKPHKWGMAVDTGTCIGCNACVIACQAENNIPVVGKENVIAGREMHWIRIDRYFKGSMDDPEPETVFQPMMCVHCENAPCEQVCPVAATVHDSEGLNVMVYNRCIGTRYCANNCPYKVRRFNYFDWHSKDPRGGRFTGPWLGMPDSQQQASIDKIKQMLFNPEVTVRMRGVMEKCSYCVQRIHTTSSAKRVAGQEMKDGDVVTACQQACPTEAIVFGDLSDEKSKVAALHKNPRAYGVLDDLNTKPRTKYLAKLRNPSGPGSAT